MTKMRPRYVCEECRITSPGVHWIDDGDPRHQPRPVPCPSKAAAAVLEQAQELAKLAHGNAWEAAKRIIEDAAHARAEFSANDLALDKDFGEAWQAIPETLHGSAFTWAAKKGLIESTGRMVKHRDQAVRHKISQWSSLVYGRRVSA